MRSWHPPRSLTALGLSLISLGACSREPALGYPRITVVRSGGYERASRSFVVDASGRYRFSSEGDDGGGTIHWTRCRGTLPADEVTPWFDALTTARLLPDRDAPAFDDVELPRPSIVNERFSLRYAPTADATLRPADVETFLALRTSASGWVVSDGRGGTCERGTGSG